MKTKHLQKNFISSMYAILISLIFFLLPLGTKAQIEIGCTSPPLPDVCCVASDYEFDVTDCTGSFLVDTDGDIFATSNGGATYTPVASVDTRVVSTIKEIDDFIELRTYVVGPCYVQNVTLRLIYDMRNLMLANASGTVVPPAIIPPKATPLNIAASLTTFPSLNVNYSYIYTVCHLDATPGYYGEIVLTATPPSTASLPLADRVLDLGYGEVRPMYTIYFKKVAPLDPIPPNSLGFTGTDSGTSNIGSGILNVGLFQIRMTQAMPSAQYAWITIPKLFEYRYPSSVVTNEPLMVNSKQADLSGTFLQGGGYFPSTTLPVVTTQLAGNYPLDDFNIKPFGLAAWDKILQYGFIYTTAADAEITYNSYNDFEREFVVTVDGTITETIDIDDLLMGGSFTVGTEEFFIVFATDPAGPNGEFHAKIDKSISETYSYWAFSTNGYTIVDPFLNIGEKKVFDGAIVCMTEEPILALTGDVCEDTYKLVVTNYSDYDDLVATGGDFDGWTLMYKWLFSDGTEDAEGNLIWTLIANTDDVPELNIGSTGYDTGAGDYRVLVIIAEDPSLYPYTNYCMAEGGNSEDPFTVNECSSGIELTQTETSLNPSDPGYCDGENVVFLIEVENTNAVSCTFDVKIFADTHLTNVALTDISSGSVGTYNTVTNVWTLTDIPAGGSEYIELTYQAANTGTSVVTVSHESVINEIIFGTPPPKAVDISVEAFVDIYPKPVADPIADIFVCGGMVVGPIAVNGVLTSFDYTVTGSIGLVDGTGTNQIPAFTAVNTTGAPITATVGVIPYYMVGTKTCPGDPIDFDITVYPTPTTVVPMNATYCDGENVTIDFVELNGNTTDIEYRWHRVGGWDFGIGTTSGVDVIEFTAENIGTLPLVAFYEVIPYYVGPNANVECPGLADNFVITVNPQPEIAPVANQTYCVGESVPAYTFTGNVPGATYYWEQTSATLLPELEADGYDILPAFTASLPGTYNFKVTMSYAFANGDYTCEDDTVFSITISAVPIMMAITDKIYCDGDEVFEEVAGGPGGLFLLPLAPGATVVHWEVTGGDNIGFSTLYGDNVIEPFIATNTSTIVLSAEYKVTPYNGDCAGEPKYFTVYVMPAMNIDELEDLMVCSQTNIPAIQFTSSIVDASFYWEADDPADAVAIGMMATDGHGAIPTFTAHNYTTDPIVVTITAYSYMEYNSTTTCPSLDMTFTITVMPEPSVFQEEDVVLCAGEAPNITFSVNFGAATHFFWEASSNASFIGLALLGEGTLDEDDFTGGVAVNLTTAPITVQIKVTPAYEYVKNNVSSYCYGEPMYFDIIVNPMPEITPIADQVYCHGQQVPAYEITGTVPNTVYLWVNLDGIDVLPDQGYGTIPAFVAENATDIPIVGEFLVMAYIVKPDGEWCFDEDNFVYFTITINPKSIMEPVENWNVCNGDDVEIEFASSMGTNVIYKWTVDNTLNAIAIGMEDLLDDMEGDIIFEATNITDNPITVVITVTPLSVDGQQQQILCDGDSFTFSITVSPIPEMFEVADQVVCVGEMTAPINFSALNAPAGTKFYWTNDNTSIGLGADGEGNIPPFEVTADVVATITVTAQFPNGAIVCVNDNNPMGFTITGYYRPVMTPIMNITVCAGDDVEVPPFASTAINPVYDWRFVEGTYIGLDDVVGYGDMPIFEGENYGTTPLSAVYGVKASEEGYCEGDEIFFVIQVNPIPIVAPVGDAIYCHGTQVPALTFTGNTVGASYYWVQTNYAVENVLELPQEGWDALPPFTANNLTIFPITLEYEVIPIFESNGVACEGEPITFTIIIDPKPEVVPMPNLYFCAGETTDPIEFTGPADEYRWMQISGDLITDPFVTDLFAGGIGDIPSFETVNPGNTALIAVIQVTPWTEDGLCPGDAIEFTIKVKPTPNVYQVADQILCAGEWTTDIVFVGDTEGTVYKWTNDHPEIGLLTSGVGSIWSFHALNSTNVPIVATIVVTPEFKSDPSDACIGEEMTFTITVNPIPTITPIPDMSFCENTSVGPIEFEGTVQGAEYHWLQVSGDVVTNDVDLFAGGIGDIPVFTAINTTTNNPSVAVIHVTPWTADGLCHGETIEFTITVVTTPTVDKPADQELCAGEYTEEVDFTGNTTGGTIYHWTNDNTIIGLEDHGSGNILSFHTLNPTNVPQIATITVTPEIIQGGDECMGLPETFTITVNPMPIMDHISNMIVCTGMTNVTIPFISSMTDNVIYEWYADNDINATYIGLDITATPTTTGIVFDAVNNTENSITVVITVTPKSVNGQNAVLCVGDPIIFSITVIPTPVIQPVADQHVCVGDMTATIQFGALNAPIGTVFYWENDNTNIGLAPSGVGDHIAPFPVQAAEMATITVTADYTNASVSCGDGQSVTTFTITGYERPIMTPIEDITLCAGYDVVVPAFESTFEDAIFTWRYVSGQNIGLDELTGEGDFPVFLAVNNGIAPATATYGVTAYNFYIVDGVDTILLCNGPEIFFDITVIPMPHIDPVANKAYCANTAVPKFDFSGTVPGAIFTWTFVSGDYIGNLSLTGTGFMPPFTTVDNNTDHVLTAIYRVSATYNFNGVPCGDEMQEFTISVLPNATITNLLNGVYCHGDYVEEFDFEGVATIWRWVQVEGQEIGLEQNSGEGNSFPAFFAKNESNIPITALYKVTPYYEVEGISCPGAEGYFTIMVNPQPFINTVPDMIFCDKTHVPAYEFSGTYGAVYHWEFVSGDPIGGTIPNSGIGAFPSFYAYNDTNDIITANFKVWSEYNNYDGTICKSVEQLFSISVLPTAIVDVNAIPNEFCHNESVPAIHIPGNIPGTSILNVRYEWRHVGGDDIGTAMAGTNTIPAFTAWNTGTTEKIAYYEVTATVEYKGVVCGTSVVKGFHLTVKPKAKLTSADDAGMVCSESYFYYIAKASVESIDFTWVRPAITGINGGNAGSGIGPIVNEKLTNTTDAAIMVEYHFTMIGDCTDPSEIFVVKVLVAPTPTMISPTDVGRICSGDTFDYIITSNDVDMVYSWRRVENPAINGGAGNTGMGADIHEQLYSTVNEDVIVEYVITLYHDGCATYARDYIVTVTVSPYTQIVRDLSDASLCVGADLILTIDVAGCDDLIYTWYHNGQIIGTTTVGVYIIPNAQIEDVGNYYVVITNGCCGDETLTSRTVAVYNKTIEQKWDDVLYVNNSRGLYHSYQWYRVIDGVKHPIDGATKQYFSEQPLSGTYIVEMFNASAQLMDESCPFTAPAVGSSGNISIYPNPVSQGGTLTIEMNMDHDLISGSIIEIYDMVGKQIRTHVVDGKTTNITMHHIIPGTYVVRITSASGETMKSEKVVVR
jgi:hypothetical protein